MIKKICLTCHKEFQVYQSEITKGGGKYCSRKCYLSSLKHNHPHNFQGNFVKCLECGKEFSVSSSRLKEGKGKYCCLACYRNAHSSTITRKCKGCGKKFSFPKWQDKICCSLSCNAKWKKIKNKKQNYIQRNCEQCGKKMEVLKTRANDERGRFCSKDCYSQWASVNLVGEKAPGWKGGVTPFYRSLRTLAVYRNWRTGVLERDQRKCIKCGRTGILLEVDHIIPLIKILYQNDIKTLAQAKNCKELWDVDNGQTLCRKCHHQKSSLQRLLVVDYGNKYSQ